MGKDKNPLWRATALWALVWLGAGYLHAQSASVTKANSPVKLSAVRFWSLSDATRVAIEISGDFEYEADRLQNPDRVFFDIYGAVPVLEGKPVTKLFTLDVGDDLVKKIRIAQTRKNVTRVVFDLQKAADYSASLLRNPNRLMVELRQKGLGTSEEGSVTAPALAMAGEEQRTAPAVAQAPARTQTQEQAAPETSTSVSARSTRGQGAGEPPAPVKPAPVKPFTAPRGPSAATAAKAKNTPPPEAEVAAIPAPKVVAPTPDLAAVPASPNSRGSRSLIRAMGLKLGRIVIDPGHGGHDTGTISTAGLYEKDIVLDIAKRLGQMLESQLGLEVIYTRTDDTFVPLTERTSIANEHRADLFLSIHLNSSKLRTVAGPETFYLNLTNSEYSLDVAARENASAQQSVHDLQDLVQKIALTEKIEESREFAERMQKAMHGDLGRTVRAAKNRGVKKAPFLVLIGASMPSVLVEIGFLSNPREETLLRRAEHRQAIAKALFGGVQGYASTLSQTRIAVRSEERATAVAIPPARAGGTVAAKP